MRLIILVALIPLLASCAGDKIYTPTEVDIAVPTPCNVTIPPEPDWYLNHVSSQALLQEKVKAILADRELNKGYDAQLIAALESCSDSRGTSTTSSFVALPAQPL